MRSDLVIGIGIGIGVEIPVVLSITIPIPTPTPMVSSPKIELLQSPAPPGARLLCQSTEIRIAGFHLIPAADAAYLYSIMSEININGYEITGLIREGGTATSWKAFQSSLRRTVAIKVLHPDSEDPTNARLEAVMANIRKTAGLKHPGIIEVIDVGISDGNYYIVTGFVNDSVSIAERMREAPVFNEKEILKVAEHVASAMGYAWESTHIPHANIKPDNLVLDPNGFVLISDFGMARRDFIPDLATGGHIETTVGTPNYMSPEQVRGTPPLDSRTDIYSFGATLYHMATGTMPFQDTPNEHAMYRHLAETIENPQEINPDISPSLALLIFRMMMKNPDDRYPSWEAVLADVKRIASGKTLVRAEAGYGASTIKPFDAPATASAAHSPVIKPKRAHSPIIKPSSSGIDSGSQTPGENAMPKERPVLRVRKQNGNARPARKRSATRGLVSLVQWLITLAIWGYLAWTLLKFPPKV